MGCANNAAFGFAGTCAAASLTTVEYEYIFWLSVATSAAFVAVAVPRVVYLSRCASIARAPAALLTAKLIVSTAFMGLRLGLVVVAVRGTSFRTGRLLAATSLELVASCFLLLLSPLEHYRCRRPSIPACSFLFLMLVYDITRCPSLWAAFHRHYTAEGDYTLAAFTALFTTAIVVEAALLALESVRRTRWIAWDAADHSPEETSSVLSLGLYSWLVKLLWRGYHEPLTMRHLYALDRAVSTHTVDARNMTLSEMSNTCTGTSTWYILLWLAKPLGRSALLPVLPRLCLLGFTFCQPFLLQRLLRFLSLQEDDSSTASSLIAAAVFTYSGIAISTALYWYYQERFQSLLRAFLISAIYHKTNDILHVGDGDPAAVTLMGADVERIYTGLRLMHEVWANAIQIAVAAWLLERQLGFAFLAPLIIVLLGFAGSFILSRRAVRYQGEWMARVQARISITSAILAHIKDLRVSGMIGPAAEMMQQSREVDITTGERSRVLVAVSASLSQLPQAVAPALAFAFGPRVLDDTRAYTALSFLTLLTAPLLVVLQSLPIIAASVACLRRIKVFLIQEGRMDRRVLDVPNGAHQKTEKLDGGKEAYVVVKDGVFGWTTESAVLQNINLCLPKSSITFVVGPIASGKSTLCRALLGEVPHVQGSVVLRSNKLAYCDQVPFLFNTSIQENIIGFASFDSNRYADVIQATMLVNDLNSLLAGDKTVIGTNGVSLSGGQRQRISLARALYHDATLLVLDDVFSGLDGSTQDQVCQLVFGPDGLLRRRGTTAIVCTHSTQLLAIADLVVVLSSDGIIAEKGSFEEIVQDEQRTRRAGIAVAADFVATTQKSSVEIEMPIQAADTTTATTTKKIRQIDIPLNNAQYASASSHEPVLPPALDKEVYRHWLSTIGALPLVLYFVLVLGVGFCSNFSTIWVKLWSADSVSATPEHSFAFWIGIYALLGAGVIICVFPAGLIMLRTAVRLSGTSLHRATVDTVLHSSLRFLGTADVGKLVNLFSQDMNIMDTQLPRMVNNLSLCLATAVGQAAVIAVSSVWLAATYPFFAVLLWAVQHVYLPSSKRLRILDLEAKAPLYTNFLDTLAGLPTIRAFGWFPHQLARNNTLLNDSQRPSYLLAMAQQWLTLTMNVVVAVMAVILVTLATQLGSNAGNVGAGLVTLITLGGVLTAIINAYTGLETSLGAISRLKNFGEETQQEDRAGEDGVPDITWPMGGHVQMQDVEASYDGADKVLKGVTFIVEAGQKVAICGRTGSGKSSILALLLHLIDPLPPSRQSTTDRPSAPILIDRVPLHAIDRGVLRERIISASQDPVFFPDGTSFRANLDPWNRASNDECTAALHELDLAAIVEAKGGLHALVSSAELSGGQKQLYSLARAVLRRRVKMRETNTDGGLLLLDEITSNSDADTERRVLKVLNDEFAAYTVIMVTHRRKMAVACDRVITMNAGNVVEDGTPEELLGREEGWFKEIMGE